MLIDNPRLGNFKCKQLVLAVECGSAWLVGASGYGLDQYSLIFIRNNRNEKNYLWVLSDFLDQSRLQSPKKTQ